MFKRIFGQGSNGGGTGGGAGGGNSTTRTVDAIQKLGEVRKLMMLMMELRYINSSALQRRN